MGVRARRSTLKERLGGTLDASAIAAMPLEELEVVFKGPPALHRFPGSMAKRTQQLCQHLVDELRRARRGRVGGGRERPRALRAPAGAARATAGRRPRSSWPLLAKRFGDPPRRAGRTPARPFSDATHRSVADVDSPESLLEVRAFKKLMKAKGKGKDAVEG